MEKPEKEKVVEALCRGYCKVCGRQLMEEIFEEVTMLTFHRPVS